MSVKAYNSDFTHPSHTQGPVDGSLYATVAKNRSNKGITFSLPNGGCEVEIMTDEGPHTTSIDSGISSTASAIPSAATINSHSHNHLQQQQQLHPQQQQQQQHNQELPEPSPEGGANQRNGKLSNEIPSPVSVEVEVHSVNNNVNLNHKRNNSSNNCESSPKKLVSSTGLNSGSGSVSKADQAELDELLNGLLEQIASFPDPVGSGNSRFVQNNYAKSSNENKASPDLVYSVRQSASGPQPAVSTRWSSNLVKSNQQPDGSTDRETLPPGCSSTIKPGATWSVSTTEEERRGYGGSGGSSSSNAGGTSGGGLGRPESRPFSYGVTAGSPAIQRRRLHSESTAYVCESTPRANNHQRDAAEDGEVFLDHPPHHHHHYHSQEGGSGGVGVGGGADGSRLTWLQRQQQKLKAKQESQGLVDRQLREQMLFAELRGTVSKRVPVDHDSRESSPSSYTHPIHVNTNGHTSPPMSLSTRKPPLAGYNRQISAPTSPLTPTRTSSKNFTLTKYSVNGYHTPTYSTGGTLQRRQSENLYDRERPFVSVKKAQQAYAQNCSPDQALASLNYNSLYQYNNYKKPVNKPATADLDLSIKDVTPLRSSAVDEDSLSAAYSVVNQSTPKNAYMDGPSSWSPSLVGTSPPGSPSQLNDRPQTPSFPVTPKTPYVNQDNFISKASSPSQPGAPSSSGLTTPTAVGPAAGNFQHGTDSGQVEWQSENGHGGHDTGSVYYGHSRRSSTVSLNESEMISTHPGFVKDTSKFWYKPKISREEATNLLRNKPPGTFVVRDSNSFPNAYGLAIKVAVPPPDVQNKTGDIASELIRHFLIEPTKKGVRLKACENEPVFGSLAALIYQHSVTPMALPCKLIIPESDLRPDVVDGPSVARSETLTAVNPTELEAACNVLYLLTVDTESLTGPQAVRKSIGQLFQTNPAPVPTVVNFKVSSQGIMLADIHRRLFFRRHYLLNGISHCGLDPEDRRWTSQVPGTTLPAGSRCFGFVARKQASKTDNQCHIFAEYDPEQPATAVVSFVNRVLAGITSQQRSNHM